MFGLLTEGGGATSDTDIFGLGSKGGGAGRAAGTGCTLGTVKSIKTDRSSVSGADVPGTSWVFVALLLFPEATGGGMSSSLICFPFFTD
eukprot:g24639.t1